MLTSICSILSHGFMINQNQTGHMIGYVFRDKSLKECSFFLAFTLVYTVILATLVKVAASFSSSMFL